MESRLDVTNQRLRLRNIEDAGILEKLKTLLLENPYPAIDPHADDDHGDDDCMYECDDDVDSGCGLYGWDDLKSMVGATDDEELRSALWLISAIEIDGFWRIIDDMYMGQILFSLVLSSKCNRWSFSSLDGDKLVKYLVDDGGYSPALARHCLELHATTTDGRCWKLDTKLVCVEHARRMLKNYGKMPIEALMECWGAVGMPDTFSFDMLEGKVGVDDNKWVYLLP